MKRYKGFSLIEALIVLLIINALIVLSVVSAVRYKSALELSYSLHQVVSDIKLTQQLADTSMQLCKIEFKSGNNIYSIIKGGNFYKTGCVGGNIRFSGKDNFSFVPSGYTDVGGSGTLVVASANNMRKIIVSSRGRIRVE